MNSPFPPNLGRVFRFLFFFSPPPPYSPASPTGDFSFTLFIFFDIHCISQPFVFLFFNRFILFQSFRCVPYSTAHFHFPRRCFVSFLCVQCSSTFVVALSSCGVQFNFLHLQKWLIPFSFFFCYNLIQYDFCTRVCEDRQAFLRKSRGNFPEVCG